jgi:hypothetical protein
VREVAKADQEVVEAIEAIFSGPDPGLLPSQEDRWAATARMRELEAGNGPPHLEPEEGRDFSDLEASMQRLEEISEGGK